MRAIVTVVAKDAVGIIAYVGALLAENDLSPVLRFDGDRHEQQQGGEEDHGEQRGAKVEGIFKKQISTMHGTRSPAPCAAAAHLSFPLHYSTDAFARQSKTLHSLQI